MSQSTVTPSLVVIGPQIKEKQRGGGIVPPAYMVAKYPCLNRDKALFFTDLANFRFELQHTVYSQLQK